MQLRIEAPPIKMKLIITVIADLPPFQQKQSRSSYKKKNTKIYQANVCLTFGDPRTEHSSLVVYPTVAARSLNGVVNLGASEKSCSGYSGGL